jgi:hypothetical protein
MLILFLDIKVKRLRLSQSIKGLARGDVCVIKLSHLGYNRLKSLPKKAEHKRVYRREIRDSIVCLASLLLRGAL